MLNIETHTENKTSEDGTPEVSHWVTINGISDEKSWITSFGEPKYRKLYLDSWEAFNELMKYTISDIEPYGFVKIELNGISDEYDVMGNHDNGFVEIIFEKDNQEEFAPCVKWIIQLDSEEWGKPWSIREFAKELKDQLELEKGQFVYWQEDDDYVTNGFGITYTIDKTTVIKDAVDRVELKLVDIFDRTHKSLLRKIDEDSLVTFFRFTDSVAIASKQYLIYFAQFLADLGIEADTELTQQAHNTLFKVIPKNKNQSLQQIKEALDVYLAASSMKPSELNSLLADSQEIAIQQLLATISHLQGQLHLANAIISAKEAESMYLRETNLHYKKQLLLSTPEPQAKVEQEEIIPGIVTVSEYDGNGVKINIARLFKMLKRRLRFGK